MSFHILASLEFTGVVLLTETLLTKNSQRGPILCRLGSASFHWSRNSYLVKTWHNHVTLKNSYSDRSGVCSQNNMPYVNPKINLSYLVSWGNLEISKSGLTHSKVPSDGPVDDEQTRMQEVKLQRVINGWKLGIM